MDMNRAAASWTRVSEHVMRVTSGVSRRSTLLIVGVLSAALLWVIAVAPTVVAFALSVGLATAWCAWLEKPKGNLSTLRELALRAVADEVGEKAASYRAREGLEPALIPERVMVCMSSNTLAPRVLRTGARIAGRLGSRWYAVYVETPSERADRINPHDADALQQNIKLAETLGATVVRVKADKPADGLIAFAQREGVTHVIFGQSARTRWELLVRGSTLDKFLGAVPDAAVQVVPLTET